LAYGNHPVYHAQKISPIGETISKWQDNPDEAEAHARTQEGAGLALEGPQAAATSRA